MKPSIVFLVVILIGSVLVVANKRRFCTEVCWTHHVLDQNCPDNCFASSRPTEEEVALTEECMVGCTSKFIGNPTGNIDMKAYAKCRSDCYNKYFSSFIDTYRAGTNKRSLFPEIISSEGLTTPAEMKRYILNCFDTYPQLWHDDLCGEFLKGYPGVKLSSSLYYPPYPIERGPDNGIYYKDHPEICQHYCQDGIEDMSGVLGVEECVNQCMESPSLQAQGIQLGLDCSPICASDEVWAVAESINSGPCLEGCFTGSLSNTVQIEQGVSESGMIDGAGPSDSAPLNSSETLELGEPATTATGNHSYFTNSYHQTIQEGKNESFIYDNNSTENVTNRPILEK